MRWRKPMQRQAMGQPIAHLIARLQSPEATNCMILMRESSLWERGPGPGGHEGNLGDV